MIWQETLFYRVCCPIFMQVSAGDLTNCLLPDNQTCACSSLSLVRLRSSSTFLSRSVILCTASISFSSSSWDLSDSSCRCRNSSILCSIWFFRSTRTYRKIETTLQWFLRYHVKNKQTQPNQSYVYHWYWRAVLKCSSQTSGIRKHLFWYVHTQRFARHILRI